MKDLIVNTAGRQAGRCSKLKSRTVAALSLGLSLRRPFSFFVFFFVVAAFLARED